VKPIDIVPLPGGAYSAPGLGYLEELAQSLARRFRTPCRIRPAPFEIDFSQDAQRRQFYSTAILQRLECVANPGARILGVTACDLYVPVLTFVFGEAQLEGNCAVVSTARLKEEVYGLPKNEPELRDRLLKEAVHELGHTFGLRHCADWRCVMTSSHAPEWLDVKSADFCVKCRATVFRDGE
jgi:archaemetzincin